MTDHETCGHCGYPATCVPRKEDGRHPLCGSCHDALVNESDGTDYVELCHGCGEQTENNPDDHDNVLCADCKRWRFT
jgi:hypothetical protein